MYAVITELLVHATLEHAASLFIVIQLGWAGTTAFSHYIVVAVRKAPVVKDTVKTVVTKVARRRGPIPDTSVNKDAA
jgi:hypothetical protein